jgi:hypothetical protein
VKRATDPARLAAVCATGGTNRATIPGDDEDDDDPEGSEDEDDDDEAGRGALGRKNLTGAIRGRACTPRKALMSITRVAPAALGGSHAGTSAQSLSADERPSALLGAPRLAI